jgi:predicted nucleic acid-binding protein
MSKIATEVTLTLVNASVALARAAVKLHVKALEADTEQAARKERKEAAALEALQHAVYEQRARYADAVNETEDRHELNQYRIFEARGRVK